MIFVGIDPGLGGAVAAIGGRGIWVVDTPVAEVERAGGKRQRRYRVRAMREALETGLALGDGDEMLVTIEAVSPRPQEGVVSAYRMGYGEGVWHAVIELAGIPYQVVHPSRWKHAEGLWGKTKDEVRIVAARRHPALAERLERKRDHGRAEALLIADYARKREGQT